MLHKLQASFQAEERARRNVAGYCLIISRDLYNVTRWRNPEDTAGQHQKNHKSRPNSLSWAIKMRELYYTYGNIKTIWKNLQESSESAKRFSSSI